MTIPATGITLSKKKSWSVQKQWLENFSSQVKKNTGKYTRGGFMWHAFSWRVQPHLSGQKARDEFRKQPIEAYYMFAENLKPCVLVSNEPFPELVPGTNDWYITPVSFAWTYVVTHEPYEYFSYKIT